MMQQLIGYIGIIESFNRIKRFNILLKITKCGFFHWATMPVTELGFDNSKSLQSSFHHRSKQSLF